MGMRNSVLPRRRLAAINPSCGNYLFITYHSEVTSTGRVNVKLARLSFIYVVQSSTAEDSYIHDMQAS